MASMAQPRGDSFTLPPGFMSGPQMRPGMSSVSRVSASPCTGQASSNKPLQHPIPDCVICNEAAACCKLELVGICCAGCVPHPGCVGCLKDLVGMRHKEMLTPECGSLSCQHYPGALVCWITAFSSSQENKPGHWCSSGQEQYVLL